MTQTIHNVRLIIIIIILMCKILSLTFYLESIPSMCSDLWHINFWRLLREKVEDSLLAIFYDRSNYCSCHFHTHHLLCSYYIIAVCRYCRKPSICLQASGSVLLLATPPESSSSWTQTSALLLTKEDFFSLFIIPKLVWDLALLSHSCLSCYHADQMAALIWIYIDRLHWQWLTFIMKYCATFFYCSDCLFF